MFAEQCNRIVTNLYNNMVQETENKDVRSKKDLLIERMQGSYPEQDFSDEEGLYGAVMGDYENMEGQLSKHKEIDEQMTGMFESNPQFAGMFLSALNGDRNPVISMIETYGDDFRSFLDDPENAEAIAEANASFVERMNKEKDLESTYEKNLEQSLKIAEEIEAAGEYTSEQIDLAFKAVLDDANRAIMGEINAEMLETKLKGLNHDADIQEAVDEATIKTKNQKIDVKKKSLRDELPMIDGKGAAPMEDRRTKEVRALDNLVKKPNIWEGMKRKI